MWTVAGPTASNRLGKNLFGFFRRARSATGIHFGEIPPQFLRQLLALLVAERGGFDRADADCLVLQDAPPEQAFDAGSDRAKDLWLSGS